MPDKTDNLALTTIADLADLSLISPQAALRRPLEDLVTATLAAAARSRDSRRSYVTGLGQFLAYFDLAAGDLIPQALAATWRPFASCSKVANKAGRPIATAWRFRGPAAVLRLVSPATLDGYRAWLTDEHGMTADSAAIRIYQARTFLAVCYREGVLTTDQAQALGVKPYRQRIRRNRAPVGRRLTRDEARRLREAVDTGTVKGLRDLAMIDLLLYQGLRISEVASLDLESFTQDRGRWWLEISGKGGKRRKIKLHDQAYQSLTAYMAAAGLGTIGQGEGPVFWSMTRGDNLTGRPLSRGNAAKLIATYGARAGLAPARGSGRLAPHDLRRTWARTAYDAGAPLLLVQQALGHGSPETTAHYIGAHDETGASAVDFVSY